MLHDRLKKSSGARITVIPAVIVIALMAALAALIMVPAEETHAATYNPVPVVDGDTRWVNVEPIGDDACEITEFNYVPESPSNNPSPSDILIPAEIDGRQVKKIADRAFAGKGLRYVKFADDSTLEYIGDRAFMGNAIEKIDSNGTSSTAILPVTVNYIGEWAFHTNLLSEVDLEDLTELKVLKTYSFAENSSKMTKFKFPAKVEEIENYVFQNSLWNRYVGTIKIPSTVTSIGLTGITGCSTKLDLTDFEPMELTGYPWGSSAAAEWKDTYNQDATYDTPFLFDKEQQLIYGIKDDLEDTSYTGWDHEDVNGRIVIPAYIDGVKVENLGHGVFCSSSASRNLIKEVEFGEDLDITEIPVYFFNRLSNLTKVENVPTTVTKIKDRAFNQCANYSIIENIDFPNVTVIENTAFYFCQGIKSVTFKSSNVQSFGGDVFRGTKKLTAINLKNMIKGSVANPQSGSTFATVYWANDEVTPGEFALTPDDSGNWLVDVSKKKIMGYIGSEAEITVPSSVTVNGQTAKMESVGDTITQMLNFNENGITSFDKVTIAPGIKSITGHAFEGITIKKLDLGANNSGCVLSNISLNAFTGCKCGNVELPETIQSLGSSAFSNCNMSGTLTLPGRLTSVGSNTFSSNNFSRIDVMLYLNSPSDLGAYDKDRGLYLKANQNVWQYQPWGASTASKQVYYRDEPQVIPKSEVTVDPEYNTVKISYKANTNGAFTIVKKLESAAGMPELRNIACPTQNGLKNPAVADMEIASKTVNGIQGGNGDYIVNMTFGSQTGSPGVTDSIVPYDVAVDKFKTLTYDGNPGNKQINGEVPVEEDVHVEGHKPTIKGKHTLDITGYTFVGWNTERDGSGDKTYEAGSDEFAMPNKDTTLYAVWEANDNEVILNANGTDNHPAEIDGATTKKITGKTDKALSSIDGYKQPTRRGYEFKGWSTNPDATEGDVTSVPATASNTVTLYAVWQAGEGIAVEFNGNGGYFRNENEAELFLTGTVNQDLTQLTGYVKPTKEGHELLGWATTQDVTEPDTTTVPIENTVLYAVWKPNKYKITFNANEGKIDGNPTKEITDDYGRKFTEMADYVPPVREGHNFLGWATSISASEPNITSVHARDQEVYAVWEKKTITVRFHANGGIIDKSTHKDVSGLYNTLFDDLFDYERPERDDYDFLGWSLDQHATEPDVFRIPAEHKTIYAVWSATLASEKQIEDARSRIAEIQADVDNTVVSTDSKDVWAKDIWVRQQDKENVQQAIDDAGDGIGQDDLTVIQLNEIMNELEAAKDRFDDEKRSGSKDAKSDIEAAEAAVRAANAANGETDTAIATAEGSMSLEDANAAVAAAEAALDAAEDAVEKAGTAVDNANKSGIEGDIERAGNVKTAADIAKQIAEENLGRAQALKAAVEDLDAAKQAAKDVLDEVDVNAYSGDEKDAVENAIAEGKNNIDDAKTTPGVGEALQAALDKIAEQKTDAQKLEDAKKAANEELDKVDTGKYSGDEKKAVEDAIAEGRKNIDDAKTVPEVEEALKAALDKIAGIKTDEQKKKEEEDKKKEEEDKKKEEEDPKNIPDEVTADTPAPLKAVEAAIFGAKNDNDLKGSTYAPLKLLSKKQTNKAVKIQWKKVNGAKQYTVYGNLCGKGKKYQKIKTLKGTSVNLKKIAGQKVKKGKSYKFVVIAEKGDKVIAISKTIHVRSAGHKKYGTFTKVEVSKKVIKNAKKLKKGKSLKLNAKGKVKKGKKAEYHVKMRYESSDKKVATVNKKGKVKAVKKGKCKIYCYAPNGVAKEVKVVVK